MVHRWDIVINIVMGNAIVIYTTNGVFRINTVVGDELVIYVVLRVGIVINTV